MLHTHTHTHTIKIKIKFKIKIKSNQYQYFILFYSILFILIFRAPNLLILTRIKCENKTNNKNNSNNCLAIFKQRKKLIHSFWSTNKLSFFVVVVNIQQARFRVF